MTYIDKKELIRKSAVKIIARDGYHNSKVKQIADEAGVANGTIYLYFKNKQEILDYIFLSEIEKEIKYLEELEKENLTATETLETFIRYYFTEIEDNIDIVKISMQEGIPNSLISIKIREMFFKLAQKLAKIIDDGKQTGEFKAIDSIPFVFMIFHLLQGGLYGFRFNGNMVNYENRKEQMFAFIIDGIKISK